MKRISAFLILCAILMFSFCTAASPAVLYAEEEERSERYERRRQRLQDIGMTTSEFDMMLQQKRSDSALKQTNKRKRPKRHKSFLDEKNFRDHE